MENGCLEREVTSFPPGNVIPGYDREPRTAWIPDHAGDDNYPVIPARAGIQGSWYPDHVGDDGFFSPCR
jgi:hypothetical protein